MNMILSRIDGFGPILPHAVSTSMFVVTNVYGIGAAFIMLGP